MTVDVVKNMGASVRQRLLNHAKARDIRKTLSDQRTKERVFSYQGGSYPQNIVVAEKPFRIVTAGTVVESRNSGQQLKLEAVSFDLF